MKPFIKLSLCIAIGTLSFISPSDKKSTSGQRLKPDADNGGITLPQGFSAVTVTEESGKARHIVVNSNGDIFIKLSALKGGKGILLLRDKNNDGKADETQAFGDYIGTGIAISNGYLYTSSNQDVYRYKLVNGIPDEASKQTIVKGLPDKGQHESKSIALDGAGNLYVTVGAPSNVCQEKDRQKGSMGIDPCPLLEQHGGIWQFKADKLNQSQADGVRYATGLRNVVGLDWNKQTGELYAMQHGRDMFAAYFPELYPLPNGDDLPSEEFLLVKKGSDFGWPYCYYDHLQAKKLLNPEYGGDAKAIGRCAGKDLPIMGFPGHWAPNGLLIYSGNQFPERYKNGAFIAFHGSWNRGAKNQAGYLVAFVPLGKDGKPTGKYEVFANGFAGTDTPSPGGAKSRPMGLAQGPDGSLYITDSQKGKVWRVMYQK
ncbi:PQQ-dependent sugar dehydrogenase [Runella sp.]|jgi:glucose/arabinose dehydrogenase|uniref:PQQ-dependent sugar dehydrogenase n=1 Tax=Runella sp. TaxID=1960881 RepID=UPI0026399A0A|nr:PQQ-dependent sugar dehydrogenase [Runella sp.]